VRGKISKAAVDALRPGDVIADTEVKGFVARRLPSGQVSYGLRYRAAGKQRWFALGVHGKVTPDLARRLAKKRVGEIADDRDPTTERESDRTKAKNTVNALLDTFLERYVRKNLRAAHEVERVFDRHVRPRIGNRPLASLRRAEVVQMLDEIEDNNGPVMADRTLAYVRKCFNWWATRDDSFVPPIVRGMARTKPTERARRRVLDDDEIRDLWTALDTADAPAPFPGLLRALLLTGQRRNEVARMRWQEVDGAIWIIPGERHKGGDANTVPLTKAVLQLLGKAQRGDFVFTTTDGKKPFSGFGKAKQAVDAAIAELRQSQGRAPMPPWVVHDLRRTARSLMSRAGVTADIGERVIGHAIPGVRGVYDRHSFFDEKQDALERLGRLVAQILEPPTGNVVTMPSRRAKKV
jgi:integrase